MSTKKNGTVTLATLENDECRMSNGVVEWRDYQKVILKDHRSGIVVLHWARQIGKSFTLAAWAVYRLLKRPGRLVTVLSNSRENGAEFMAKCAEICHLLNAPFETKDRSVSLDFSDMRMELRIRRKGKVGRIKVLAANPRTARGFSGDLILDEFAFHEDAEAIWAAAEPILASNKDFLCRIASTGNGRHNLFYRMVNAECGVRNESREIEQKLTKETERERNPWIDSYVNISEGNHDVSSSVNVAGALAGNDECRMTDCSPSPRPSPPGEGVSSRRGPEAGWGSVADTGGVEFPDSAREYARPTGLFKSREGFWVSRISRTMANRMGVQIYDTQTREAITPEQARAQALDKRLYDQNYECAFADENLSLLTHELISAAEDDEAGIICDTDWNACALAKMREAVGPLYVGFDVGRKVDLSVITVLEKVNSTFYARGILRIQDMRLPDQELRLGEICRLPKFCRAAIDMTGLGLGLYEYARKSFGSRIRGINFASTVPVTKAIQQEGRKRETARVTETMAVELLRCYEDRRLKHPRDGRLRDDLRKPEKVTSPGGRVSISATRDEAGHADHFWSLALAVEAAGKAPVPFAYQTIRPRLLRRHNYNWPA